MDIETVQRRFTRLVDGIGLMTYEQRCEKLGLTTLLERRARGDLIETFKIVNGFVQYGNHLFNKSVSGEKLVLRKNSNTNFKRDFFSSRVVKYWNKLPSSIKTPAQWDDFKHETDIPIHLENVKMVTKFKHKLEDFKKNCLKKYTLSREPGHYWEVSQEVFARINEEHRDEYIDYMISHPAVAKRKHVNIH